jgi:type II secretory pathway pseudopilin PulG
MTLVEVVAGLALLGSLLVGLLLTRAALVRQRVEADRRLEAIRSADALLSQWRVTGKPVPRQASGRLGVDGQFVWRTRALRTERIAGNAFDVVRLELTGEAEDGRAAKVLASVDVLKASTIEERNP